MSLSNQIADVIDATTRINAMVYCAHMAAEALPNNEQDALQHLLDETQDKLKNLKANLYIIHEQAKGLNQ